MNLKITAARLEELEACEDGVDDFRAAFGEVAEVEWTPEKQREILLSPMRKWFSWGWRKNLFPVWDLSWSNLSRSDLSRSDLSRSDLEGAKICLCNKHPCVALRETLDAAGWTARADGLLEKKIVAKET